MQAAPATWEDMTNINEAGRTVLRAAGITPTVARRLMMDLGFSEPQDLEVRHRLCKSVLSEDVDHGQRDGYLTLTDPDSNLHRVLMIGCCPSCLTFLPSSWGS